MAESHPAKRGILRPRICKLAARQRISQVSLEYVMIIALTFAIMVPTTYLFYSYSKESSQEIVDAQVTKLGRAIVDSAETIFYSGQGSRTLLDLNVPENVG